MERGNRNLTVKSVNFNRPDYEIKRVRGGVVIVSLRDKTMKILTKEGLKALKVKGVPLKLRFDGLSRAQMGGVLATLKTSDTVAHVKPILLKRNGVGRTDRKIYFDTVIEEK